jgi:hypothetical protein
MDTQPAPRRHATLTVPRHVKQRIEHFARAGRWTQSALVSMLLDQYEHELKEATAEAASPAPAKKK